MELNHRFRLEGSFLFESGEIKGGGANTTLESGVVLLQNISVSKVGTPRDRRTNTRRQEQNLRKEFFMNAEYGNLEKPINILLVEDNEPDVVLTREAFSEAMVPNHIFVAEDGVEAMAFLRHQGKHADVPRPDLVLLDLNLPRKDGRVVLDEIKSDPELSTIPVVVLTTSTDESDIMKAYSSHANCYIAKPVDFTQFTNVVRTIESFWLTVVKLPII
jgi:two-component system, chemotaxis family, response regulator Rcp1